MSQIEDIYKHLGGELPSADFSLDSSEDEDTDFTNYKPQNGDGIDEVVNFEFSNTTNVDDSQLLGENAATHFTCSSVDRKIVVSAEEEGYKETFTRENTIVSATDTVPPVDLLSEDTGDQILSMTKLEDIENFMDTLLDSELVENIADDTSQRVVPHETELSTAKPLTDVQLMDELCKINEKLSSTSEHKSSSDIHTQEDVKKQVNILPLDSCIGSVEDNSSTIFIDLRPQKPAPMADQSGSLGLSSTAKKLLTDRLFPSYSSTNDSDDDSGEEDAIWSSYRKQMKSQSLSSSSNSQENIDSTVENIMSSNQNVSVDTGPLEDIQSWAQMLQDVTSSVQHVTSSEVTSVVVSSSSELDDVTAGDALPNNGPLGKPPIVSKAGKKAKVRKHAKKKKKAQTNQDEKKGETYKSKQKNKDISKKQGSEPCNEVKLEDDCNTGTIPNNTAILTQYQDQNEDINKIKLRLEAQISARKGFGVVPSQEVVYDKDATYEPVLCQTSSSVTTNALLTVELDYKGLPIVDNLQCDTELDNLKAIKSWLIALLVMLVTKDTSNETMHPMPFIVTGLKQTVFDGKPAIVVAISTLIEKESNIAGLHNVNQWLNDTSLEQLAGVAGAEVPSVITEGVCDEDSLLTHPLSDILCFTKDTSSFFMPTSFYWDRFGKDNGTTGEMINCDIETTVTTIHHNWLCDPIFLFSVLNSVTSAGLDLAGLRLVQEPDHGHPLDLKSCGEDRLSLSAELSFVLALAIRGPQAINRWAEVVGPADCELAKVTDPTSLSALFGRPSEDLMWYSRNVHRAFYATAKWFGGRACIKTKTIFGINDAATKIEKRKWQKVRFADSPKSESTEPSTPTTPTIASHLFAANHSKIILTVSPKLAPSLYPHVFSACNQTGYKVLGIKRMRLNQKRARMLSLSNDDKMDNFTPSSPSKNLNESPLSPLSPLCENAPPMPSLLLILSRENAMYHSSVLSMCLQEKLAPHFISKTSLLVELRIAPYSDMVLSTIKSFTEIPSKPYFSSSKISFLKSSVKEVVQLKEELSVLCLFENQVQTLINSLEIILCVCTNNGVPEDPINFKLECKEGEHYRDRSSLLGTFELLGLKWLPKVEKHTLQDIKVFEDCIECFKHGDTITSLMMQAFVVVVFRSMDANNRIRQLLYESNSLRNSSIAVTTTGFAGIQLASLLFASKELFPNFEVRHLSTYLSPQFLTNSNIFQFMEESDDNKCVSVLAVKADSFKLFVKILEKLCRHGFKIVGLRVAEVTGEMWINMRSAIKRTAVSSQLFRCYVICFEYVNAVWQLEYEVFSYVSGGQAALDSVYWSHSYLHAARDVHFFFPNGLCCEQNSFTEDNKILCPVIDIITCQNEVQGCVSADDSPLTETNCIVVPSKVMLSGNYSLASDLECLVALKFTVVCLESVYFSLEMKRKIFSILSLSRKEDVFIAGTSILIVVKRDNAASCFQSLVQQSELSKNVVVPKSSSEAAKLMDLLFHNQHKP